MEILEYRLNAIEHEIFLGNHIGALTKLDEFLTDCAKPKVLENLFPEFKLDHIDVTKVPEISGYSIRLATTIQTLLLSDKITFDQNNARILIHLKDWISAFFSFLPFRNTDHILSAFASGNNYTGERLWRFCALYTVESNIEFDWEEFFNQNQQICMVLAFSILSSSQFISKNSAQKRDILLAKLPKLIDQVDDLGKLPIELLHHAYMRCSYSTEPFKHDIKCSIVNMIRRDLFTRGYVDSILQFELRSKPTIVLILDWWTSTHAMFRCYSDAIKSLSKKFYLIAFVHDELVDEESLNIFDQVHRVFSTSSPVMENFSNGYKKIRQINPDVVYFPSVGMSPMTLFFACIRNAPLQLCSPGHPATTASPCIDYIISSPEFYGETSAYKEQLWMLPKGMYSFKPLHYVRNNKKNENLTNTINIAISASVYKISPAFLDACKVIEKKSSKRIKFNFYLASVFGLQYVCAKKSIINVFPNASVYPNQDHSAYLSQLENNHFFLSPFPFGNTNGIVDAVVCGLPGVCLYGPEPHSANDCGMFKIFGFPDFLITNTLDDYIKCAIKLVETPGLIEMISDSIRESIKKIDFSTSAINLFGDSIYELYLNHNKLLKNKNKSH